MTESTLARPNRRRVISLGILFGTVLIGWRLYDLQISHHQVLRARAQSQTESSITIPGPRGEIVDRFGLELAASLPVWVLATEPARLNQTALIALERATGTPGRLTKRRQHAWLEVRRDCDDACRRKVEDLVHSGTIDAQHLHWSRGFARRYPAGGRASHVLGYCNLDGSQLAGIERVYDARLRSQATRVLRRTDALQRTLEHVAGELTPPAMPTLRLTLDTRLQVVLGEALSRAVENHGAKGGRGVILDVRGGDVLAMASNPGYDANLFHKVSDRERLNGSISLASEPGSVMKPFTAVAILEGKAYRSGSSVHCEMGQWKKGQRLIRDTHRYGILTLPEVIEVSSNIGIVKFAQPLSSASFHRSLTALGFGSKTGIDLPAESSGLLPKVADWSTVTRDSIAFGHNLTSTTLQLAVAMAAIANGGTRVTPRLGEAWILPDGSVEAIDRPEPKPLLDRSAAITVRHWLRRVVEEEHGTGKRAQVEGYFVAGKTGTAELVIDGRYSKTENLSSFVGFAPVDDPVAVVVISIESPRLGGRTGGVAAAPAFSEVMSEVLRLHRIVPDNLPEPEPDEQVTSVARERRQRPAAGVGVGG
jgi:cell division protein FtsI (penicillin-binding protein 3)